MERKDKKYSKLIGCGESIKLTTVKPSGTSSLLPGVPPGVHPEFADHYIRRITFAANNPLVDLARERGFSVEPMLNLDGSYNYGSMIVDFPVKAREGAVMEHQLSAVDQLENQLFLQRHWSDSAVSMTCYYKPEELPEIQEWLSEHYEDEVKTCSFLRHQGHGFKQAPYERITGEQYAEMSSRTRPITRIDDCSELELDSLECATGACPTR
jgi:ribonucleoside-diphosphate reductase alpha chain/ribonucleoside-triphosphate reductase